MSKQSDMRGGRARNADISHDLNAGVGEEGVSRNVLEEAREVCIRKLLSEHTFVT